MKDEGPAIRKRGSCADTMRSCFGGLGARLEGVFHPGEPPPVFVHLLHKGDQLNWLNPGVLAAPWWRVI